MKLPIAFFQLRQHGDLQSRFRSLEAIHSGMSSSMITAQFDAIVAAVMLAIMFCYSAVLSLIAVGCVAVYAIVRWTMHAPTIAANEESIVASAKRDSFLLESIRGIETLKVYSSLPMRSAQFLNISAECAAAQLRVAGLTRIYQFLSACILAVSVVGTIFVGAWLVMRHDITLGMLFAFILFRGNFTTRLVGAFDALMQVRMLYLHAHRVSEITLERPKVEVSLPGISTGEAAIEVQDVAFSYPGDRRRVFEHLDLNIKGGSSVAIIGPSGCGKTTLGKIFCGLLQPATGRVTICAEEVLGEDAARRHSIAVVSQSDVIFSGTILQNVILWDGNFDLARVRQVCREACILDDIDSLPLGFNSPVGEGGAMLSGGQRQRIFMARALYRAPRILILDEATSHLDVNTETRIAENLSSLRMTRVVIAHRPHLIALCDQVVDLTKHRDARFKVVAATA